MRRNAAGLASSWAAFTIWCSPPAIPRPPRASKIPLRMTTALHSFQTPGVAPLALLASAGGVAAASKRCAHFCFRVPPCCVGNCFLLWGEGAKKWPILTTSKRGSSPWRWRRPRCGVRLCENVPRGVKCSQPPGFAGIATFHALPLLFPVCCAQYMLPFVSKTTNPRGIPTIVFIVSNESNHSYYA